jgi:hypothetical protein
MSTPSEELHAIVTRLQECAEAWDVPKSRLRLKAIEKHVVAVGKAWCGSWLGFESRIYYNGLKNPPPGTHFSSGYSRLNTMMNSSGDWAEYGLGVVEEEIHRRAGNPDLKPERRLAKKHRKCFEESQEFTVAVLRGLMATTTDPYFGNLLKEAEGIFRFQEGRLRTHLKRCVGFSNGKGC